ncbi:hypothetical protein LINGRAHAP2_LOCUS11044, partial [Linum grandiflorum]
AGIGGYTGELRGVRLHLPDAAGDLPSHQAQSHFLRRCFVGIRLGDEAPSELPRSARFAPSLMPHGLFQEEGHLRPPLQARPLRRWEQGLIFFGSVLFNLFLFVLCKLQYWGCERLEFLCRGL